MKHNKIITTITPQEKSDYDKDLLESVYISSLLKQRDDLLEALDAIMAIVPYDAYDVPLYAYALSAIARARGQL